MLRIFRILKLPLYFDESQALWRAFVRRRRRILVFLGVVLILVVLLGTVMYLVEGQYRTRPGLGLVQENNLTSSA
jgi:voltage-gated potassium channel